MFLGACLFHDFIFHDIYLYVEQRLLHSLSLGGVGFCAPACLASILGQFLGGILIESMPGWYVSLCWESFSHVSDQMFV